jgi:hypothetical protein
VPPLVGIRLMLNLQQNQNRVSADILQPHVLMLLLLRTTPVTPAS